VSPRSLYDPPALLSSDDAQALAKRALSHSTADAARVTIVNGSRGNTRFAVNQISTAGDNTDTVLTVRSEYGKRAANASTNALDDDSLKRVVETSERLAKLAPEDPEAMPELGPQAVSASPGYSASTAALDPAGRAAAVSRVTEPARAAKLVATGYLETDVGSFAVANSKGLFDYSRQTSAAMTTTVRTPDASGSGWAGAAHSDWRRIDPSELGEHAIEKARRSVNAVAVEPGRYTVILEPTAVGNLIQLLAFALNARNADEGRSFFTKPGGGNKIGQKVVDERVSLWSDPMDPDASANTFTAEGLPVHKTVWIEEGVVRNLAYDRFWAEKQNTAPSPLIGSLRMPGGTTTQEEMVASVSRGILVTRFWYIRPVDPRTILYTGLTRDGTFLIEDGKITRAVKNLRFNESPIFMLNNLEGLGPPVRVSASEDGGPGFAIVVPPVMARDFTFTSLSDAV